MKKKKTAGGMLLLKLLESRIRHFKDLGKEKTASNYSCAIKHFMKIRNEEDIEIADLTVNLMKDFQAYLVWKRTQDEYHIVIQPDVEGYL